VRADRLVAALLVLQARGRVTAAELAEELEISERTARRDLEALGMAGVPVYSQPGRGGGWSLVGGARTDLSGLTAAEARALFLLAGPSSEASPPLKAALRKLVRALPASFREDAEAAASAIVIDPASWDRTTPRALTFLGPLEQAVIDGVQVRITYAARGAEPSERVAHPLGLASKGHTWYLIANTDAGLRTFRVGRIRSRDGLSDKVIRPDDFDLPSYWSSTVAMLDERRAPIRAVVECDKEVLGWLRASFGSRLGAVGDPDPSGRFRVEVRGHSVESLAGELAGIAAFADVLEPDEVKRRIARMGAELVARYGS
jgi:predicted DNA-binding transcriptional regulator YafY